MRRRVALLFVGAFSFLVLAAGCGPTTEDPCDQPKPRPHCGSTDEPCCLQASGAPDGQLLATCTPGGNLRCEVVAGTDTTMSYCRYVGP